MNRKKLTKRLKKAFKEFSKHCKMQERDCKGCVFNSTCCIDELRESIRVLQEKELDELEGMGK